MAGLAEHQLRALARLMVEGRSTGEVADLTGVCEATVRRYASALKTHGDRDLDGGGPPNPLPEDLDPGQGRFLVLYLEYQERRLKVEHLHAWRLTDFLDDAYTAIGNSLRSLDAKVASANAWRLFEEVIPTRERAQASLPTTSPVQVNVHLQQAVAATLDTITHVAARLEGVGPQTYTAHLRSGRRDQLDPRPEGPAVVLSGANSTQGSSPQGAESAQP